MIIPNLDKRKESDIVSQIKYLAKQFVPEWNFTEENPDFGVIFSKVFSKILFHVIESQLTAGCINIAAETAADSCVHSEIAKHLAKSFRALSVRSIKSRFIYLIKHNKIDMGGASHSLLEKSCK